MSNAPASTSGHRNASESAPEVPLADPASAHGYGGIPWRVSYTPVEAAAVTGVSRRTIGYAVERGDLTARYPSTSPVILHADLLAWLEAALTDRATAPRRPATGRAA